MYISPYVESENRLMTKQIYRLIFVRKTDGRKSFWKLFESHQDQTELPRRNVFRRPRVDSASVYGRNHVLPTNGINVYYVIDSVSVSKSKYTDRTHTCHVRVTHIGHCGPYFGQRYQLSEVIIFGKDMFRKFDIITYENYHFEFHQKRYFIRFP